LTVLALTDMGIPLAFGRGFSRRARRPTNDFD
jgi:hypothetical protein